MDELLVVIHDRADHSKRSLSIPFSLNDTVQSIEEKISTKTGIPPDLLKASEYCLNVVLCGRALERTTFLRDLLLGPTTSLIVFVENRQSSTLSTNASAGDTPLVRNTPEIGSFYVWCKKCNDVQRAKLRVYCSECSSSALLVKREPSCWKDVLRSRQIEVHCADCNANSYAAFSFKCIKCNEVGAVLSHIRGNWEHAECSVCLDEHTTYLFDFGCRHLVCRQCLYECLAFALKEGRFVFRPLFGYTIACPYPGCERCIADAHHFRILGNEKYQQYQKIAAEKLVELDDRGVFCPYPDCNSSFFWEIENDDGKTSCPDCLRLFCRLCKSADCVCGGDDPTTITIQATTKKCPGCKVNTERNEGCTHIHCTNCGMDWCFICVGPWTEDCQWNHWFD
ncbi:IBR domain protein [Cooperia oncophora]